MEFQTCRNEVKLYLDARFVSAHEGGWHLFMFVMHAEVPNVVHLQIHLPGQQYVTWNPNNQPNIQQVVDQAEDKDSNLTAYFKANADANNGDAHQLLYHEFSQKFVWVAKTKRWKSRQKGFAIGRMYYAGERFISVCC